MKYKITNPRCLETSLLMTVISGADNMPDDCGKAIRRGAELLKRTALLCGALSAENAESLSEKTRKLKRRFSERTCLEVSEKILSMADSIPEEYRGTIAEGAELLRDMAGYCTDLCQKYDADQK